MLEPKDFLAKGYVAKEVMPNLWLLKKTIKGKYTIKVLVDEDSIEPEVQFESSPVSTLTLQVDNRTSIEDIEEFFETMYNSLGEFNNAK